MVWGRRRPGREPPAGDADKQAFLRHLIEMRGYLISIIERVAMQYMVSDRGEA
jgi:hypothetical protein